MCGFFVTLGPAPCAWAPRGVELLRHRGPDTRGVLPLDLGWATVTVGMGRLKVVDLTDYPMPFDFRTSWGVVLAYNGEVYNWRELRQEIEGQLVGVTGPDRTFQTRCDAEVVAAAWRMWGVRCLERFNGMWGLALVDTVRGQLFLARDRAGEKPVYWARRGPWLHFASEPKALPLELRPAEGSWDVETLEFDFREETAFCGVEAIPPASYLLLDRLPPEGDRTWAEPRIWWRLPEDLLEQEPPLDQVTALVEDAIRIRHVAEVPVAVQLSGGLDSAIVQAVVRSSSLYCVTFPEDGVDNLTAASKASQGHEVVPLSFTKFQLFEALPEVAYHLDTPGTWTAVCQYFLNRRIAADGNVVVLSGEGADEVFGGYARYRVLFWLQQIINDPHLAEYAQLINRALGGDPSDVLSRILDRAGKPWSKAHAAGLVDSFGGRGHGLIDMMQRTDFFTTMQVLLRMADRMASAFSIENRAPFLDYRLIELGFRLPLASRVTDGASKDLLRRVAGRLGVHPEIVQEQTKRGLFVPPSWGSGARWDRRWFARLMSETWREVCCRDALTP